jgi:histidinol phosphatase-like enzyme (inositol monophosphatase family)
MTQQGPTLSELTEFAVQLARRAGEVTLEYFRHGVEADLKADGTPVTAADRGAEELLRREIGARFPADGIVGEEFGADAGESGRVWILDPIDGTRSFVHGVPLYGVLVGLEIGGETALGVIHLPALGETVWAYSGGGCWWNGARAGVSQVGELGRGLVTTSDVPTDGRLDRLFAAAGLRRTWGDCYGYALVATGRAEAMIDPVVAVWDVAAVKPIIEEAGGRFTDLHGRSGIRGGSAVGTNGLVHDAVLGLVKG